MLCPQRSIPELLQSCQPQHPTPRHTARGNKSTIWRYVTDAPHYRSSCATLCGQLVTVGDLSGNNVLLIAGKAKITDFGMSQLLDSKRHMTPSPCALEPCLHATRGPQRTSCLLQENRLRVLQIQIMTHQFPDPGPATRVVENSQLVQAKSVFLTANVANPTSTSLTPLTPSSQQPSAASATQRRIDLQPRTSADS